MNSMIKEIDIITKDFTIHLLIKVHFYGSTNFLVLLCDCVMNYFLCEKTIPMKIWFFLYIIKFFLYNIFAQKYRKGAL